MKHRRFLMPCLSALLLLSACGQAPATPPASDKTSSATTESTAASAAGSQTAQLELSAFSNIEVDVLAADIRLVPGETWSLSYALSEKEPVEQVGVVGDTLYLETRFDLLKRPELVDGWHVTITVPEDAQLLEIDLETVAGSIEADGFTCTEGSFATTAGPITLTDLTARELDAETVAGDLTITNSSADQVDVESTSGSLTVEGRFGSLETDAISGSTAVTAALSLSAELESVSGGIGLSLTNPAALTASSAGGVTLNGEKVRGTLTTTGGTPVEVKSVSGQIAITAP